ncbi:MAG: Sec-independent protein translocase protein TatB [Rheinheimera sp.]|nr:Sec-independent protein translocase protein TatB [Rheinheimera sp.]
MSFWELVVVGIVALLVLGPEKLPGAIRTVTGTIRSIRQFGHQMKSELSDELRVHELHEKLRQAEQKGLLGLSADEINALAELRQAAADVNNPYGKGNTTPATEPPAGISTTAPEQTTAAPVTSASPSAATAPAAAPASNNHTAQVNEQKTSS